MEQLTFNSPSLQRCWKSCSTLTPRPTIQTHHLLHGWAKNSGGQIILPRYPKHSSWGCIIICVFILILFPHAERFKGSSGHSIQFTWSALQRGNTAGEVMDAWLKQQVWDPLPRLQSLVSQQETLIFYTEPTGLSALCCRVAGALQQGLHFGFK